MKTSATKSETPMPLPENNIEQLHQQIVSVITTGKQTAYRAVNSSMVLTYWEIGRLIVEEEQEGKEKAQYGTYLLRELSKRLKKEFGSGYAQQSLRNYRGFYKAFPIRSAVRSELTWTHYRLIMRVENPNARTFYEEETIKSNWDTRSLERQIHTFYYERLLSSSDRIGVAKEAENNTNHENLMGKLTHQDVGQMDMYVRMYEDKFKIEGDNPTIGIILCSEKNEAVVKYSVLSESQHIFASKYVLYLPTEKELVEELERERILAELKLADKMG